MTEKPTPAVVYAAKSTEDKYGSIPTQIEDCRTMAEREGWEVVGEFSDEAFSAYSSNRGPGLAQAKETAIAAATEHGRCILVAQDADRFARGAGDAPGAADHLGEIFFALRRQDVALWTVRSRQIDLLHAAVEGERANSESARKSQAVKAGLKRRAANGAPIGGLAFGYGSEPVMVDGKPVTKGDRIVTEWLPDSKTRLVLEDVWQMVEQGLSCGQIARTLNARGLRTQRGKAWRPVTVRQVVRNDVYLGQRGYPKLIDQARWDRLQELVDPKTPAGAQRRQGGRPYVFHSYLLKDLAFCSRCGAPIRIRTDKGLYVCRNKRTGTGLCDARSIPTRIADEHVLRHLHWFIGSVEDWITERVQERSTELQAREKTLARERGRLGELERQRQARMGELEEVGITALGLEVIEGIDRKIEAQQRKIGEAEAMTAEWQGPPDVNAALDYYSKLVDAIRGKVAGADGVEAVNAALTTVVAGLWISYDGKRLEASFALRPLDGREDVSGLAQVLSHELGGNRITLPATDPADYDEIEQTRKELAAMVKPDSPPNPTDSTCAGADRPSSPGTARSPRGP